MLQTRVGIDFKQPGFKGRINKKIHAKELKARNLLRINDWVRDCGYFLGNLLHFLQQIAHFPTHISMILIKVMLKLLIAQLISLLILAVLISLILDGIVGEMSHCAEFFKRVRL